MNPLTHSPTDSLPLILFSDSLPLDVSVRLNVYQATKAHTVQGAVVTSELSPDNGDVITQSTSTVRSVNADPSNGVLLEMAEPITPSHGTAADIAKAGKWVCAIDPHLYFVTLVVCYSCGLLCLPQTLPHLFLCSLRVVGITLSMFVS